MTNMGHFTNSLPKSNVYLNRASSLRSMGVLFICLIGFKRWEALMNQEKNNVPLVKKVAYNAGLSPATPHHCKWGIQEQSDALEFQFCSQYALSKIYVST